MLTLALTTSLIATLAIPVQLPAQEQKDHSKLVEFDPPGTTTVSSPVCAPYCGAFPFASNNRGEIVGWYTDSNVVPHGFLRTPDGQFVSFDAPGAGLGAGLNQGTVATAINGRGDVAGQFEDPNDIFHGFVRYRNGSFVTFDAPGAGTGIGQGTVGAAINPAGDVSGYYLDANNVLHGFLRTRDGVITTFDAPGAGTGAFQGTVTGEKSINPKGEIDGWYTDSNNAVHGFVRAVDGSITTIDGPQSVGTIAGGINPSGAITGYYADASNVLYGFLRARDGSFTTFQAPGAGTGIGQGTGAFSINPKQAITGITVDSSNVLHGFLRDPSGSFITLNAPDAGTAANQGTRPEFVNDPGLVVGFFYDANNVGHGFFWTP
jgi:hypothetical protein